MKTVTLKEFELNFDVFMDDITENGRHYKITYDNDKAVMVIPYAEYELLLDTYTDWVEETKDSIEESF
jgi:PHD/YefM family antitoxin component YafN of YafNO toxin-antitoxin module